MEIISFETLAAVARLSSSSSLKMNEFSYALCRCISLASAPTKWPSRFFLWFREAACGLCEFKRILLDTGTYTIRYIFLHAVPGVVRGRCGVARI